MNKKIVPIILAGGCGSRLWPLSRQAYPKQFLPLINKNETLLQTTVLRVAKNPAFHAPIIVCHEEHRFIVAEQLRQIDVKPYAIILEPEAKNTAPAIALAAYFVKQHMPSSYLWVMPADHVIHDSAAMMQAFQMAQAAMDADYLVAFGIQARYPETAYGYIQINQKTIHLLHVIDHFVEKPDLIRAENYVKSGEYYWNCGIFAFRAEVYLAELKKYASEIANICENAMQIVKDDGDFIRPNRELFISCPSNSIDYAVMEKTTRSVMVELRSAWNDVGSWDALMREHSLDSAGNVTIGDVVTQDVRNSYLRSDHKMLAVAGVSDHIVVVTDDAVLVAHKTHCQHIKQLVNHLKENNRTEVDLHLKVHRPWGFYQTIAEGPHFKVKKIMVHPQHSLSLQRHQRRSEHWVVIAGEACIINGKKRLILHTNESTYIPAKTEHRLANITDEPLELIEVQVGDYLGEDDIERLGDIYGRLTIALSG